jgi:hypothetical protein
VPGPELAQISAHLELAKRHDVRFCHGDSNADLRVNCVVVETYILSSADRAEVLRTIAEG